MADDLRWLFELIDKVSVPAKKMHEELEAVKEQLTKTEGGLSSVRGPADEAGASFGRLGDVVKGVFGGELLAKGAEKLGDLALEAAKLGLEFVKSGIEAADFGDRSKIAFEALLGSAEKADQVLGQAKQFAFKAAQPFEETLQSYQQLLLAKVKPIDIPVILQGATDLQALSGGRASLSMLVEQFARVSSQGELAGRALTTLAASGLDVERLAHKLGHSDFLDLQRSLNTSPVSAGKGLHAIFETLAEQQGGQLGATTLKLADTVGGSIQRIKTGWATMLDSLNEAPAFEGFREHLGAIAQMFDVSTAQGQQFQRELDDLLSSGLNLVNMALDHKADIADFFSEGLEVAKAMLGVMKEAIDDFKWLHEHLATKQKSQSEKFPEAAKILADPTLLSSFGYHAHMGEDESRRLLTHLEEGGNLSQANRALKEMGIPALAEGGHVDGPTLALIGEGGEGETVIPDSKLTIPPATSSYSISGGGDGARSISIAPSVSVMVNLPEKHQEEDLQDFVQRLEEALPSFVQNPIEQLAVESGVS